MDAPTIRTARGDEHGALVDLMRRSSLVWESQRDQLLGHPEVIEVPASAVAEGRVRVAESGGRLVGFSLVVPLDAARDELDGLFVDPDAMRAGVGRALVEDLVSSARARGVSRIEVTANPVAMPFYDRLGFVVEGVVETHFAPAPRMHLAVS